VSQSSWLTRFSDYYNQHLPLFVTIWLLGILFLQLRLLGQLAYVQRLKHYGSQLLPATWNDRIQELEEKLRIQKRVQYLISLRVESPMVIGWLKPIVLIPEALFNSLSDTEIYAVLAHEIAHIRREDFIVNLLQTFLCNVFFFHPGVWWMSNRIDDEREHCCDDLAVAATGPATTYAKTLINVSQLQLQLQGSTPLVMALAGKSKRRDRVGFSGRIKRLFKANDGSGSFREGFTIALILTSALFFGVAATGSTGQNVKETLVSDKIKTEILPKSKAISSTNETSSSSPVIDNFTIVPEADQAKLSLEEPTQSPLPPESSSPISTVRSSDVSTTQSPASSGSEVNRIDALVMACKKGDFDLVKSLVDVGVDIEGVGSNGATPLMMATSQQEDDIVEFLLRKGADVNQHYNNWTALMEAADEGSLESMKLLLNAGADVSFYKRPGSPTAITMAASEGHLDCLELLLKNGADINGIGRSLPPLHIAAGEGKGSILDYLISQKVNVDKRDPSNRTALMHAASEGKKSIVKKLIKAGANVSIKDNNGKTAIDHAIAEDEYAIRIYLEDINEYYSDASDDSAYIGEYDSDARNNRKAGRRPRIHQATYDGLIERVERMVRRGTDINSKDSYGQTPLHIASAQGYNLDMLTLINLGADIDAQDNQGRTPMMHAAADGYANAVTLLVSRRANVNIKDVDGMRAFEWSHAGGNADLTNFLGLITDEELQKQQNKREEQKINIKDVQAINKVEKTAINDVQKKQEVIQKQIAKREELHDAMGRLHQRQYNTETSTSALLKTIHEGDITECIRLLKNGISSNTADDKGLTALMVAASTNKYDIAKLLIEQGADVNKSSASGLTALHYAALENAVKIAQLLIDNNANLEATMRYSSTDGNDSEEPLVWEYIGATPLLIATESGKVDVLTVLIDAGANTNHQLIRNEYRLKGNRESYLSGGEVMGLDKEFLNEVKVRVSDHEWTPYKQALLSDKSEILNLFKK